MTLAQIAKRIERLEKVVSELQEDLIARDGKWWIEQSGQFAGDPVHAEIVRRGRAYRKSLKPKARKPRH